MADNPYTGSKWGPSSQFGTTGGVVTYSFNLDGARFYGFDASIVGDYFQSIVRSAFDLWESIARIDFRETTGGSANIQVGIDAFDGRGGTLGEATWSIVGNTTTHAEVALDSAEVWNAFTPGGSNLYAVLVHEIGHTIGLEHVSDPNSIMYPYLGAQSGPSASDIAAIQGLYGAAAPLGNLIYGTPGTEIVNGTDAKDRIDAGAGDDIVYGYFGADLIYGSDGNDTIFGNQDNDTLYGGFGNDLIYGGLGDDQVYGNQGDDQISGSTGNDSVYGGFGNDFMFGDDGNDALYGGPGNDTLHGGTGDDTLSGGAGADLFRFAANNGRDVIVDFRFADGDRLSLGGQGYFVSESNGSAVVNLPGGGTITLIGVTAASLEPAALVA